MIFLIISAYLVTLLLSLGLAFIVYSSNHRRTENLLLVSFILSVIGWIIPLLVADSSKDVDTVVLFSKLAIIGPAFVPPILFIFSLIFPERIKWLSKTVAALLFIPSLAIV